MSNRFSTHWADDASDRVDKLENQIGELETETSILREFVEEAAELLRVADFSEQGDFFDAQHLLAEIDTWLQQDVV